MASQRPSITILTSRRSTCPPRRCRRRRSRSSTRSIKCTHVSRPRRAQCAQRRVRPSISTAGIPTARCSALQAAPCPASWRAGSLRPQPRREASRLGPLRRPRPPPGPVGPRTPTTARPGRQRRGKRVVRVATVVPSTVRPRSSHAACPRRSPCHLPWRSPRGDPFPSLRSASL